MRVPLIRSSVALIGAGTQGRRLAFMWSSQGKDVHLVDGQPIQLENSVEAIKAFRAADGRPPTHQWGEIITHSSECLSEALKDAWLVVECVPEQLALKKKVVAQLDALAAEDTIIASNSSSYCCSEIVEELTLKHPTRILSAHSYWPPETSAIEIMGHDGTHPAHVETMMRECTAHGFSPFHVRISSMGYIYNRIWAAIKREALLTAAEGAATPGEIDAMFKDVLKTPKGPFEQMDVVGLDVVKDIEQHYADVRGNIPELPREYLKKYLDAGQLGVKTGKGFYEYNRID